MRVIGEIEARRRVRGAAAHIDAERADLPVRRDGPDEKEDQDQRAKEQQEPELPSTPPSVAGVANWHRHVFGGRLGSDQAAAARRNKRHLDRGLGCGDGGMDYGLFR